MGVICVFTREHWYSLPPEERKGWMIAVDLAITLGAFAFFAYPAIYAAFMTGKDNAELAEEMAKMDEKLANLTSHPIFRSPTARKREYAAGKDVERYRVIVHEGVKVVEQFEKKGVKHNKKWAKHNDEPILLEFGSIVEPLEVRWDDFGASWVCIEHIVFPKEGEHAGEIGDGTGPTVTKTDEEEEEDVKKSAARRAVGGLVNFAELHTGIDLDGDGDTGVMGGEKQEDIGELDVYDKMWVCTEGKTEEDVHLELIDDTDPQHPHLWKVAVDSPDVYTTKDGDEFVDSIHLRYGNVIRGSKPEHVRKKHGVPRVHTSFAVEGWIVDNDVKHVRKQTYCVKHNNGVTMSVVAPSEWPLTGGGKNFYKEKHFEKGDEFESLQQETALFHNKPTTWHYIKLQGNA